MVNIPPLYYFMIYLPGHVCCAIGDGLAGTPLTTSARISALNIVGELLRKVGVRDFSEYSLTDSHILTLNTVTVISGL